MRIVLINDDGREMDITREVSNILNGQMPMPFGNGEQAGFDAPQSIPSPAPRMQRPHVHGQPMMMGRMPEQPVHRMGVQGTQMPERGMMHGQPMMMGRMSEQPEGGMMHGQPVMRNRVMSEQPEGGMMHGQPVMRHRAMSGQPMGTERPQMVEQPIGVRRPQPQPVASGVRVQPQRRSQAPVNRFGQREVPSGEDFDEMARRFAAMMSEREKRGNHQFARPCPLPPEVMMDDFDGDGGVSGSPFYRHEYGG